MANMQYQEARLRSFTEATIKPKGRSKAKPTPASWPLSPSKYPKLTPENLALAGYYYAPIADDLDQCGCFLCDSKLGGWDEDDDPFEEHFRRGKCGWGTAVCSIMIDEKKGSGSAQRTGKARLIYDDPDRLPQSEVMSKARIKTFAKWWPHPGRGWLPTPTTIARAGFVYTPTDQDNDCVTCHYCDYSTVGWEPTDDPWEIHQRKRPGCSFFKARLEGDKLVEPSEDELALTTTKRPTSRSTKSTKSTKSAATARRTTRKTVQPAAQPETSDTDAELPRDPEIADVDEPFVEEVMRVASPVKSKAKAKQPRATTASRGRKAGTITSATRPAPVIPELAQPSDIDELAGSIEPESEAEILPKLAGRRVTRTAAAKKPATSKTAAAAAKRGKKAEEAIPNSEPVTETEQEEVSAVITKSQPKASKARSKLPTSIPSGDKSALPATKQPSRPDDKAARSKTASRAAPSSKSTTARSKKAVTEPSSETETASETESQGQTGGETESEAETDVVTHMEVDVEPREDVAERMRMIDQGAKEARSVIENLDQATPRAKVKAPTGATSTQTLEATPPGDTPEDSKDDREISLTDEQAEMTVVEYIRSMYVDKHRAMKSGGEAKIKLWEDRARGAREIIEGMRCRDD